MNAPLPVPPPAKVPLPRYQNSGPATGRAIRHGLVKPHIFRFNGKWHCQNKVCTSGYKGTTSPTYAYRAWERAFRWAWRSGRT